MTEDFEGHLICKVNNLICKVNSQINESAVIPVCVRVCGGGSGRGAGTGTGTGREDDRDPIFRKPFKGLRRAYGGGGLREEETLLRSLEEHEAHFRV